MKVLVTGHTGLVGAACVTHLVEQGHEVLGVSRTERTSEVRQAAAITLGTRDAADRISAELPRCDAIVHCAASLELQDVDGSVTLVNCVGTQQVLSAATVWNASRLVYMSSIQVIGAPERTPINEAHPTQPVTPYHASKLFGEHLVAAECGGGLSTCSLRITSPLGPRMPAERIAPHFVRTAQAGGTIEVAGAGSRRQSYVDVRDVSRAVSLALERPRVTGAVNVSGTQAISNLDLAMLCSSRFHRGSSVEMKGTDPQDGISWDVSLQRAKAELGYEPAYSLESSLDTIAAEIAL